MHCSWSFVRKKNIHIESTIIINLARSQAFQINMHSRLEFFFFIVALINGIQRTELTHTVYHHEELTHTVYHHEVW